MTRTTFARSLALRLALLFAAALALLPAAVRAADTDIASAPLFTSSNTQVKPNILFIMDDSGSMAWDYLPDVANFSSSKYGKYTSQCNGVAYNPAITYLPPLNHDGTSQPNASLSVITSLSDPNTQTTSPRTLTGTVRLPTALEGTVTLSVSGSSMTTTTYQPEQAVTIFQNGSTGKFFTGEVVSWNRISSSSGTLVVDISQGFMEGNPGDTLSSPRVGRGVPSTPVYYVYSGSEPALSYTYTSSRVNTSTTFYRECNSSVGSTPGSSVFTAVSVTASSAEAQNYANWATYYNTRMKMMKAGVSRAFAGLDARYRIGYTTINERTATSGANFLDIADFDATQKQTFYSRMFDTDPGGNTPLRGALAKAGQYFAKKARGQTVDPIQYSCQRNFAILSTDGYWNTGSESTSTPKYGPYKLDNSTSVGQQDGSGTPRPMLDGQSVTSTVQETWTVTRVVVSSNVTPQSSTQTTTTFTLTVSPTSGGSASTKQVRPYYTRVTSFRRSSTGISRSGSTITVSGVEHGMLTGERVTVTGGNNASLRVTNAPITRISATSFSYEAPGASGSISGTYTFTPELAGSCPSGRGPVRTWLEVRNANWSVARRATTVSTTSTRTVEVTTTTRTRYTRTVVSTDGVVTSDNTVPSAPTSSSVDGTTTVTPGTTTTSTTNLSGQSGSQGNSFGRLDNYVLETGTTCATSTPTVTTSTLNGTLVYTGVLSVETSTTTGATTTTTLSDETSESAHVSSAPVVSTSGGTSNTLADVAMYYYNTDLRDNSLGNCTGALGLDVCLNNVPGNTGPAQRSFGDSATWQHMTTFTLGLGVGGLLNYDPNYLTQTSGDFIDILNRTKNWPEAGSNKGPENTDDLWHAAVNGRGQYFSAGDPNSLAASLAGAIDSIKAITGAAAAASTSSLQPVEGDNDVFVAQFTSVKWHGDVLSYRIDPVTGSISSTPAWSARAKLDAKSPGARTIYYPRGGTLRAFTYANLTADGLNGHFDNFCNKTSASGSASPEQCPDLNATDRTNANNGANLVAYLRGDRTRSYYRARDSLLGDIVSASPLFVGKPSFKYTDSGYSTFVNEKADRTAVVLAAANDGMLHAFRRTDGEELWAFMPSFVLPNLYKLADNAFANYHSYFVDGSPQMGDVYVPSGPKAGWRTIVVGGLNGGGKGYYALDVTDPAAPEFLWEFTHANLGLTFGNPIITKRTDGTWIVAFTSGYNNNTGGGDGNGHLFVLNAYTGALITSIPTLYPDGTPAGNGTTPSGLGKLNTWVDTVENNTARRFYAGDLQGNLWRFDLDGQVEPHNKALLLAKFTSPDGTPQSITTRPQVAEVKYNGNSYPVAFIGTGRYLGLSDAGTTTIQSVYAIKDPLNDTSWGTVRSNPDLVTHTMTITTTGSGAEGRAISTQNVNWSTKIGWRADFPASGERVTANPQLALNTLTVGTILPSNTVCTVGGQSFLYRFDITTGGSASGSNVSAIGTYVGNVLIQGLTTVQLGGGADGSGAGSIVTITTRSDATLQTDVNAPPLSVENLRRTSWRELVD